MESKNLNDNRANFLRLSALCVGVNYKIVRFHAWGENIATADLLEATHNNLELLQDVKHDYDLFCERLKDISGLEMSSNGSYTVNGLSGDFILAWTLLHSGLDAMLTVYHRMLDQILERS